MCCFHTQPRCASCPSSHPTTLYLPHSSLLSVYTQPSRPKGHWRKHLSPVKYLSVESGRNSDPFQPPRHHSAQTLRIYDHASRAVTSRCLFELRSPRGLGLPIPSHQSPARFHASSLMSRTSLLRNTPPNHSSLALESHPIPSCDINLDLHINRHLFMVIPVFITLQTLAYQETERPSS